jgi:asparagine synthase (glutamine-hydrolysing)
VGRPEAYWDPLGAGPGPRLREAECVEAVRSLIEESVRLRMMADVPCGAFLSGGIDSSTIVALMARHSSQPVNTFTVGYKDSPAQRDAIHARLAVGARHHRS